MKKTKSNFVSKPYFKLDFKKFGFYFLRGYSFHIIPKFFIYNSKYMFDTGINLLGWNITFQWRKF